MRSAAPSTRKQDRRDSGPSRRAHEPGIVGSMRPSLFLRTLIAGATLAAGLGLGVREARADSLIPKINDTTFVGLGVSFFVG